MVAVVLNDGELPYVEIGCFYAALHEVFMKSSDIPDFVKQLQNVIEPRCILVDGPWGCGKTTAVLETVTRFQDPDSDVPDGQMVIAREICYMSVYGFCSTKDMQRSLIEAQNKDARQIGEKVISVFRMITPFVKAFSTAIFPPAATILSPWLEEAPTIARKKLKTITKKQKNDVIIIIDDLERLSPSIEYNEMLGFVDQLKKLGNSIVCLADSTHMGERRKDWHLFLEKCFDRICEIEQTDEETLKKISGLSDDSYMAALQESIGKNYRLAERARMLKEDVMRVIEPEVSDQRPMMLSPDELLLDCVLCCRCVLDTLPKQEKEKNQDPIMEAVREAMKAEKPSKLTVIKSLPIWNIFSATEKHGSHIRTQLACVRFLSFTYTMTRNALKRYWFTRKKWKCRRTIRSFWEMKNSRPPVMNLLETYPMAPLRIMMAG